MMRAVASVPPPAPQGTISWTGRCGYCACGAAAAKNSKAATSLFMVSSSGRRSHCNHAESRIFVLENAMNAPAQAGLPALPLKDPKLFREQCYIDGQWVSADAKKTLAVINPASGQTLGTVPDLGVAETRRAIQAAERAWPAWRAKTAKERAVILRKWFELMMASQDDLAQLLTAEQGKPLAEARGEIAYGASFIEWFAEEGKRAHGDTIPSPWTDKRVLVIKQPIGVAALITPWNFPNAMITRKAGPALAAGCTVVLKPAGKTPYSALAMAELGERAGIPKGVFNVITGNSRAIGGELCANPAVRKLSFTGSTETGRTLMKQSADTIKKLSLELGGNAPFIVFDDADLDAAVEGSIASKYRNAGQTCVCANRIYVQDGVYDAFAARLAEKVKGFKVGPGTEPGVVIGPLIDQQGLEKVEKHVADALGKGARAISGAWRRWRSTSRTRSAKAPERSSAASAMSAAACSSSPPCWRTSPPTCWSRARRPSDRWRL